MDHPKAKALVSTCIDFRLQDEIDAWIDEHFEPDTYDRVSLAGNIKNLEAILHQVKIAHDLHHIQKVVLINHEDCGAYGKDGTYEKHIQDLKNAKGKIQDIYPDLELEIYYLYLNGKFEAIK